MTQKLSEWQPFDIKQLHKQSTYFAIEKVYSFDLQQLPPIHLNDSKLLEIPELGVQPHSSLIDDNIKEDVEEKIDLGDDNANNAYDVWDINLEQQETYFKTWEAFNKQSEDHQIYFSEQSIVQFDALAQVLSPSIGILPQDTALKALSNLLLGRSSVFFQWTEDGRAFEATLKSFTISGCTTTCVTHLIQGFTKHGTLLRRLREDTACLRQRTSVHTIVTRAIAQITDRIENWIMSKVSTASSILQLEHIAQQCFESLDLSWQVYNTMRSSQNAEDVVSNLITTAGSLQAEDNLLHPMLKELLKSAMQPWLQSVLARAGLVDRDIYGLEKKTSSMLLSSGAVDQIASIEQNLELLESHDITIQHTDAVSVSDILDSIDIDEIMRKAKRLEQQLEMSISQTHLHQNLVQDISVVHTQAWTAFDVSFGEQIDIEQQQIADRQSISTMEQYVINVLDNMSTPIVETYRAYDPVLYVQPFIDVQHKHVQKKVLTLLFDCGLQQALDLHKATFLFGNAGFAQRLTYALFDHTRHGLCLNDLDISWPPTSSKLSLSLMDILRDDRDQLSFAVRELSEDAIRDACEVRSVHALDFIKLQYSSSSPLDMIFTPESTKMYDEIFSALLLHTRMVHLVTMIRKRLLEERSFLHRASAQVKFQAHIIHKVFHLTTSIATYAVDVAVQGPWRSFEEAMRKIKMSETVDPCREHIQTLKQMRRYLFIGRRYEDIRTAYHNFYNTVLQHANELIAAESSNINKIVHSIDNCISQVLTALQDRSRLLDEKLENEQEAFNLHCLIEGIK